MQILPELEWYYNVAASELNISSSFSIIVSAAFGFSPPTQTNHTEDKLIATLSNPKSPIRRLRTIENTLAKLSKQNQRILNSIYESYNYPQQIIAVFGRISGATLFNNNITIDHLIQLCAKKLSRSRLNEEERVLYQTIEREAKQLYEQAHNSYIKARGTK